MKFYRNRSLKILFALLMALIIMLPAFPVVYGEAIQTVLEDGIYDIGVTALRIDNNNVSMADASIEKPAKLELNGGRLTALITHSFTDFSIKNSLGEFVLAETVPAGEKKTSKIEIADIDAPVEARIFVSGMGSTVQFRLIFDKTTLPGVLPDLTPPEPPVQTPTVLQDGVYDIGVTALRETSDALSSADSNLIKPAKLKLDNGKLTAFITMKNSHQMTNFSVKNSSGEFVPAEVVEENPADENKKTYKIEISDIDAPVMVQTFIAGPNITVRFRLVFDKTTLPGVLPDSNQAEEMPPADPPQVTPPPADPPPADPPQVTLPPVSPPLAASPSVPALNPANLADGEYQISVSALRETEDSPSRMADSVKPTAHLQVAGGTIYALVAVKSDSLQDFKVRNSSGSFQLAEIYGQEGNYKTYRFQIQDLNTPVTVQIMVPAMGMTVNFRLRFNINTLAAGSVPPPIFILPRVEYTVIGNTVRFTATPSLDSHSGKAVARVSNEILDEAFKQIQTGSKDPRIAQIAVEKIQNAVSYEIIIPAGYLSSIDGNRKIEIQTELGWITLPENLLNASQRTNSGDASIIIQMADKSKLGNAVRTLTGNKPVIEITLKINGKTAAWGSAAAPVSVSVPYKPTAEELKNPQRITAWYIDGHIGKVMSAVGSYDEKTGMVTFTLAGGVMENTNKIIVTPVLKPNSATSLAAVTADMLESAFSKFEADYAGQRIVTIEINKIEDANDYEIMLPVKYLSSFSNNHKIEIRTSLARVLLSGNMLNNLSSINYDNAALRIKPSDKSELPEAKSIFIGERPVLEIYLMANDQRISWNNPSAPVSICIPYVPTAKELENPEHITIWYKDGSGSTVPVPSGRYDAAKGAVTFTTAHFSKYAVVTVDKSFNDIIEMDWAKKQIEVLASKGVIYGTSSSTFTPEKTISRADYIILLTKMLNLICDVKENFRDVQETDYFYKHVGIARNLGIVSDATEYFYPRTAVTRNEMAGFTQNALKKAGFIATTEMQDSAAAFVEKYLLSNGDLNQNMTRAEAAVFLYELYNIIYPVSSNAETSASSEIKNNTEEIKADQTNKQKSEAEVKEYKLDVTALREADDGLSMANGNFVRPAKLQVINGKMTAFITVTGTDRMTNFKVQSSTGEFKSPEIFAKDEVNHKTTYKIEIANIDKPMMVQAYIVPMDLTVKFRLTFKKESI